MSNLNLVAPSQGKILKGYNHGFQMLPHTSSGVVVIRNELEVLKYEYNKYRS